MEISEKIRQYFKSKSKQILAESEQAINDHSGLKGSHREGILCDFLEDILPKRFSVSNGMVYGLIGNSKEADIVICDELNYPRLPLKGSNLFFSESVKAIIEVKTNWNSDEFEDIKTKTKSAINIFNNYRQGVGERLNSIEAAIWSMKNDREYHGKLISPKRIGTAAIAYYGGQKFDIESLSKEEIERIENEYPEIILLLDAGKIIIKDYEIDEENNLSGKGFLRQITCNEDSLLVFVSMLTDLLANKSEHFEPPMLLTDYLYSLYEDYPKKTVYFQITRPIENNAKIFWKEN